MVLGEIYPSASLSCLYHLNGNSTAAVGGADGSDTSVTYSSGFLDREATMTANSGRIDLGNHFDGAVNRSWFFWLSVSATSTDYRVIFSKNDNDAGGWAGMILASTDPSANKLQFQISGTPNPASVLSSSVVTGDSNRHFWVITLDGSGNCSLYKDSVLQATDASSPTTPSTNSESCAIGNQKNTGGWMTRGLQSAKVDEIGIANYVMTIADQKRIIGHATGKYLV